MNTILETSLSWLAKDKACILAVVAETWGSAPRAVGSLMVIGEGQKFEGSVSGGCVEGTVIAEASGLLTEGKAFKSLAFTVSTEEAWQAGLACGGKIRIDLFHITGKSTPALKAAVEAIDSRKSSTLIFNKISGEALFSSHAPNTALTETEENCHVPTPVPTHLITIGAVHIAQALAPMATACGFQMTVIDPRAVFTETRSFEGATVITDWPDSILAKTWIDRDTAIIALTHDPKIDDAALRHALNSKAFYIGALGSKKTQAARLERLGLSEGDNRIHGPIGLDIGAATPAEIAVAIMAEVIQAKHKTNAI